VQKRDCTSGEWLVATLGMHCDDPVSPVPSTESSPARLPRPKGRIRSISTSQEKPERPVVYLRTVTGRPPSTGRASMASLTDEELESNANYCVRVPYIMMANVPPILESAHPTENDCTSRKGRADVPNTVALPTGLPPSESKESATSHSTSYVVTISPPNTSGSSHATVRADSPFGFTYTLIGMDGAYGVGTRLRGKLLPVGPYPKALRAEMRTNRLPPS